MGEKVMGEKRGERVSTTRRCISREWMCGCVSRASLSLFPSLLIPRHEIRFQEAAEEEH